MIVKIVENKVNLIWKNICLWNKFLLFVVKSFVVFNIDLFKFYYLIKMYKMGLDIKIRFIVLNVNGFI